MVENGSGGGPAGGGMTGGGTVLTGSSGRLLAGTGSRGAMPGAIGAGPPAVLGAVAGVAGPLGAAGDMGGAGAGWLGCVRRGPSGTGAWRGGGAIAGRPGSGTRCTGDGEATGGPKLDCPAALFRRGSTAPSRGDSTRNTRSHFGQRARAPCTGR